MNDNLDNQDNSNISDTSDSTSSQDNATTAPPLGGEGLPPGEPRTLAALAHGLGIFAPIIAPLAIMLLKKQDVPSIERPCKEALNFQITFHGTLILVMIITCLPTMFFPPIGCLTTPLFAIAILILLILQIMATMAAFEGKDYRYPARIEFVK